MYCVKCKTKREGKDIETIKLQNGRKALKAKCEKCGALMVKLGIKQDE